MMKNYFRPNSKAFKVIELLNEGKTYDEAAKIMKYKDKGTISSIVSRWKTKDRLNEKNGQKIEEEKSTSNEIGNREHSVVKTELSELEAFKKEILEFVGERGGIPSQGGAVQEKIEVNIGSLVRRVVLLTPKTLLFFDTAKANDYPGDLSSYINDTVNKLYEKKGIALGLVQLQRKIL